MNDDAPTPEALARYQEVSHMEPESTSVPMVYIEREAFMGLLNKALEAALKGRDAAEGGNPVKMRPSIFSMAMALRKAIGIAMGGNIDVGVQGWEEIIRTMRPPEPAEKSVEFRVELFERRVLHLPSQIWFYFYEEASEDAWEQTTSHKLQDMPFWIGDRRVLGKRAKAAAIVAGMTAKMPDSRLSSCNGMGKSGSGAWMPMRRVGTSFFDPGGLEIIAPREFESLTPDDIVRRMQSDGTEFRRA